MSNGARSRSPPPTRAGTKVKEIQVIGDSRVLIAPGLLEEIPARLEACGVKPAALAMVSDKTVDGHYGDRLMNAFAAHYGDRDASPKLVRFAFAPGEASKNRETKAQIEDFMLSHKCTRDSAIIALGGGVVGDLAGFTAATYMRGVPVVQVPTSTMAMIDSSVGGKTALNVPAGKNLIGAFHQPKVIFADPTVLSTLSRREVVEGLAEAIKMGVIRDAELFQTMAEHAERIIALDAQLLQEVLHKAVKHKAEIVAIDEKETGLRATLNYGHTIGHAIEALVSPEMLHGECVSIGCVWEAELAVRMGHLEASKVPVIRSCFQKYGLPVVAPKGLTLERLMEKMAVDKKNQGKTIRCTVITSVGASVDHPLPVQRELMEAVLVDMLKASEAAS
ncbi:Pentafunctional AROM polypeptide [Includes: 3-dehydroquinate synthase (DHQS) [Durusdinium trenchii]|uniref:Pentafunctional AROM polypeptide n=1 Tax=Durusdinium trenchii TaxID=1381693 RepID=A0ABP0N3H0_9DINO